jgi:vacuolar protein sorting-associated protein 11
LYERLQVKPMLLARYAANESEKSRRQMLAMCQTDPEILAEVLGLLVAQASDRLHRQDRAAASDEYSESDSITEILEDVQEALCLARRQGVLLPVRITRILAGEGCGQFSSEPMSTDFRSRPTVPLSVAIEFVGTYLEAATQEVVRLKSEIDESNRLCNAMEKELETLLHSLHGISSLDACESQGSDTSHLASAARLNIDAVYAKIRMEELDPSETLLDPQIRESFWRDLDHSEGSFDTFAHFFAKNVIN